MKSFLKIVLIFFVGGKILFSLSKIEPIKEVEIFCHKVKKPPEINGYLKDDCWKIKPQISTFIDAFKNVPVKHQTKVYLCYDDKNLYIGFKCEEPEPEAMKSYNEDYDGSLWTDNSVEVFLDVKYTRVSYFHFITNTIGAQYDEENYYSAWNIKWEVKTSLHKNFWIAEIRIPFSELNIFPKKGDVWGVNFGRNRYFEKEPEEISCWTFGDGTFHAPHKFGRLVFK